MCVTYIYLIYNRELPDGDAEEGILSDQLEDEAMCCCLHPLAHCQLSHVQATCSLLSHVTSHIAMATSSSFPRFIITEIVRFTDEL